MFEDPYKTDFEDEIELFGEIANSRYFKRTRVFLIFNQIDLLENYITKHGKNGRIRFKS